MVNKTELDTRESVYPAGILLFSDPPDAPVEQAKNNAIDDKTTNTTEEILKYFFIPPSLTCLITGIVYLSMVVGKFFFNSTVIRGLL